MAAEPPKDDGTVTGRSSQGSQESQQGSTSTTKQVSTTRSSIRGAPRLSRRKVEASASAPKGAGTCRLRLHAALTSAPCDTAIMVLILANMMSVVLETNIAADGNAPIPRWMQVLDLSVISAYTLELILRLICYQGAFFRNAMNVWDFVVICLSVSFYFIELVWASVPFPIELLRISRAIKITRAGRIMAIMPELHMMVKGLVFAMRAIAAGVLMLIIAFAFWGILAVIFIHPLNMELAASGYWEEIGCERCPRAFESVQQAMLSLTVSNLAGDAWGQIALPITELSPLAGVLFFFPALITTNLAVMNLILAAIVDKANEIREHMLEVKVQQKEDEFMEASQRMYRVFLELDEDKDGFLDFDEFVSGYHNDSVFANLLRVMDIQEQDLEVVFKLLDTDGSGRVEYKEFVEQLYMMNKQNSQTLLVLIKFHLMELRKHLLEEPQQPHQQADKSQGAVEGGDYPSSSGLSDSGRRQPSRSRATAPQLPAVVEHRPEDVQSASLLAGRGSKSAGFCSTAGLPSMSDASLKVEGVVDAGAAGQREAAPFGDAVEETLSAMRLLQQRLEMHHSQLLASLQAEEAGLGERRRSPQPSRAPPGLLLSGDHHGVPPPPPVWPTASAIPPDLSVGAIPLSTHTRLCDLRGEPRQDVAGERSDPSTSGLGEPRSASASVVGTRSSVPSVFRDSSYALQRLH